MLLQAVVGSFCSTAFAPRVPEPLAAACPVPQQPERGQAGHPDSSLSSPTAASAAVISAFQLGPAPNWGTVLYSSAATV